ncbi:CPW-WPC family protein [Plasmodium sp. gorilla clade G2]|uniref:CPW-WPC family protein n=1 Tax=Plasmodium sp. gorilla clade G2 TaxID=880535 RepID=UPI000D20CE6F|nr:CPW-WPC family protein [Plasmodium sp. gorilla clade G2]SOV16993.1 CPW-WPC family protein [Plasmodium sp. gorilla clade G2]
MSFSKYFLLLIICSVLFFLYGFNNKFVYSSYLKDDKIKSVSFENIPNEQEEKLYGHSPFGQELINSLSLTLKRIPLVVIAEKVKRQLQKAAESLELGNPNDEMCEINYSKLCPEDWIDMGDGISCLSPLNYKGPCEKKVIFRNATAKSKYNFSINCNVSWPCTKICIEDFSKKCPENWIYNSENNICEAPKNYAGKCIREKNFDHYSPSEKKIWTQICDINWSCYDKNYNFNILCPLNWKNNPDNKTCSAPISYMGPCNNILYLYNFSDKEKITISHKCNVEWPVHEKKEINFNSLCPIGWHIVDIKDNICQIPLSYNGPCKQNKENTNNMKNIKNINNMNNMDNINNVVSFKNFSKEQKYHYSQRCNVQWPLENGNIIQNDHSFCPYNWILINEEEHICVAPIEYEGPCENIFSFKNYTAHMKSTWASACNVIFTDTINAYVKLGSRNKQRRNQKIFGGTSKDKNISNIIQIGLKNGPMNNIGHVFNYDDEKVNMEEKKTKIINNNNNNIINNNHIDDEINLNNLIVTNSTITDLILLKETSDDQQLKEEIDEIIKNFKQGQSTTYTKKNHNLENMKSNNKVNRNNFSFIQIGEPNKYNAHHDKLKLKRKEKKKYIHMNNNIHVNKNIHMNNNTKLNDNVRKEHHKEAPILYNNTDNINEIKNLYENYKIEKENNPYHNYDNLNRICQNKNYNICPIGWTYINHKKCLAPKSYISKFLRTCNSILNLDDIVKTIYDVTHDLSFVSIDKKKGEMLEKNCNLKFPCLECERDYVRVNCPLGWKDLGDGKCKCPSDYPLYLKNLCGIIVNFKYASPLFKKNWSYLCKSDWPCFSSCEKDYGKICPIGYKIINERREKNNEHIFICTNENWKDYKNVNNYLVNTTNYIQNRNLCHVIEIYNSMLLKKEIEKKCNVTWPCIDKCEENFYQTCPYNWIFKDNKCIAPYYYVPPKGCSQSFDILSFSNFDKFLYSNKCFAPWPCKDNCQPDWIKPCPQKWTLKKVKDKLSSVTINVRSDNEHSIDMDNNVDTDDNGDNEYSIDMDNNNDIGNNFDHNNSYYNYHSDDNNNNNNNIDELKDKTYSTFICFPPSSYKGPCNQPYDLTNFTFLQKQDFSFRCNVQWPCGSSSHFSRHWQTEQIYDDINFKKRNTLKFYNSFHSSSYIKYKDAFF